MKKDLLAIQDLTREEIEEILSLTDKIKVKKEKGEDYTPLKGKTLGLIFKKPSTRTRISFEVGMFQLGGHTLFLNSRDLQMERGEDLEDSARVFSHYLDGLVIRTFSQSEVEKIALHAGIPVINGLTDLYHPCQVLADLYTIKKRLGSIQGVKLVYLGDGNNMANTWLFAAAIMGMKVTVCSPSSHQPLPEVVAEAKAWGKGRTDFSIEITENPESGIKDADVVYTDVWVSMGQEIGGEEKKKVFRPFQVNADLLKKAKEKALIMHCLPAHRGEEITHEMLEGERSVVYEQVENRLHVQKAVLDKFVRRVK